MSIDKITEYLIDYDNSSVESVHKNIVAGSIICAFMSGMLLVLMALDGDGLGWYYSGYIVVYLLIALGMYKKYIAAPLFGFILSLWDRIIAVIGGDPFAIGTLFFGLFALSLFFTGFFRVRRWHVLKKKEDPTFTMRQWPVNVAATLCCLFLAFVGWVAVTGDDLSSWDVETAAVDQGREIIYTKDDIPQEVLTLLEESKVLLPLNSTLFVCCSYNNDSLVSGLIVKENETLVFEQRDKLLLGSIPYEKYNAIEKVADRNGTQQPVYRIEINEGGEAAVTMLKLPDNQGRDVLMVQEIMRRSALARDALAQVNATKRDASM